MSDSPYREAGGRAAGEPTHCLFCGEERDDATGTCRKCGAVSSASNVADGAGFSCPRCSTLLTPQSFGRATIDACAVCHGFFCRALQFSLILNDYLNGVELPLGELTVLPPGKQPPPFALVKCIACGREMDRVNFAARSDAIVDVCAAHGMWLDAGELVPILHFVKTRADLGEVPLTEEEQRDQTRLDVERNLSDARRMQAARAATVVEATLRMRNRSVTYDDVNFYLRFLA